MDPNALGGMLFTLLFTLIIVGAVLTFPIMRRLGAALELWLNDRRQASLSSTDARALRNSLSTLADRLERLEDRQLFLEELVERSPLHGSSASGTLPPDGRPGNDGA